jgi:hypothetical protein
MRIESPGVASLGPRHQSRSSFGGRSLVGTTQAAREKARYHKVVGRSADARTSHWLTSSINVSALERYGSVIACRRRVRRMEVGPLAPNQVFGRDYQAVAGEPPLLNGQRQLGQPPRQQPTPTSSISALTPRRALSHAATGPKDGSRATPRLYTRGSVSRSGHQAGSQHGCWARSRAMPSWSLRRSATCK